MPDRCAVPAVASGKNGWGDARYTGKCRGDIKQGAGKKVWETIRDLGVDMSVFDVLSYPNLFHNLKAAIKDACTSESGKHLNIYYEDTSISPDEMLEIVRSKDFSQTSKDNVGSGKRSL